VRFAAVLLLVAGMAPAASAQVNGHVSVLVDVLPDLLPAGGNQHVGELRMRVFAERRDQIGEHVRTHAAAYADALLADRNATGEPGTVADAIVRPLDLYVDVAAARFDVRAGLARVVWGRLDEFLPTDVVNPIDLTRFILEGRAEARLPVALIRGRAFLPMSSTLEALVVPAFRASRFDQLDERSSPFNLAALPIPVERDEPGFGWSSLQGGARFTSTVRRVDWSVSAYRGLRTFPIVTVSGLTPQSLIATEAFPRFTMLGADFETVRGPWGVRGEAAVFVEDVLQSTRLPVGVPARSVEAGAGADRRAGDYRVAANVLWSWRGVDAGDPVGQAFADDDELNRDDLSLVVVADRSFARETRTLRVLTVYDPIDATAFGRIIAAVSLRDDVWVEGSGGIFTGSSPDTLGRLTRRDFVYTRLKIFF
jgi:hypothetical protein